MEKTNWMKAMLNCVYGGSCSLVVACVCVAL